LAGCTGVVGTMADASFISTVLLAASFPRPQEAERRLAAEAQRHRILVRHWLGNRGDRSLLSDGQVFRLTAEVKPARGITPVARLETAGRLPTA
jgi:hypothetical protein